ncbi:VanW family protein [Lyticum sinuosum]|uniref:VanW domain-containing protein n=1 Tax=Lyticum sinuosum TaxID=1332059 RepID=A0AAE5AGX8_9RICK|nr:VanW family protein [Lyticum sinuosum]MDZ5760920.1 VanW domain-containing protein [Lyticum sinuosum]
MKLSSNKKLLSEIYPLVYWIRVWQKRIFKIICFALYRNKYVSKLDIQIEVLPYRYTYHKSRLIKKHSSDELYKKLQINKIKNLQIVVNKINGIIIKPGKTFSFCKVVGLPTKKRGFVEGMELCRGKPRSGTGGGICQIANLLNWMAWHTPLEITQRSIHSFDPFPDNNRILPFGSGAAIFWNYVDLQITNNTESLFQIKVWIDDKNLKGEIRTNSLPQIKYSIFEKEHFFIKIDDLWYRSNEIWRKVFIKNKNSSPIFLREEMMVKNFSKVCYEPDLSKYQVKII